ncbi:MAG: hypothetical protein K940chlam9_01617 [Chlamydiae bacterium]|nr:hypothetical protein [Chlamydiota bacterium]
MLSLLGFSGGCGGAIDFDKGKFFGREDSKLPTIIAVALGITDFAAIIAMGIILGVAAGGALHLSPAAAFGMTGAIAAIPLLDIAGGFFYEFKGKALNCFQGKSNYLEESGSSLRSTSTSKKKQSTSGEQNNKSPAVITTGYLQSSQGFFIKNNLIVTW